MTTHSPPLGDALESFRRSIFRVQSTVKDSATGQVVEIAVGTAFVLCIYKKASQFVIATAGHVIDVDEPARTEWLFAESDARLDPVRKASFVVSHDETRAKLFHRHKHTDVGILVVPGTVSRDGKLFVRDDERPLPLIDHSLAVSTGTRVAWAGYASAVESFFHTPCLCYFEGSISLLVDRPDAIYYIIDGHNTAGISGGPVWHWSEDRQRFEVVAIISAYASGVDGLPGFVIAEPIHQVTGFLRSSAFAPDKIKDALNVDCRLFEPTSL